jgi:putative membrane protein
MQISSYIPTQMSKAAWWLVLVLAGLQITFMGMEMFRWERVATDIAGLKGDAVLDGKHLGSVVSLTWPIGLNMGLYNGFLAAGLIWSLCLPKGLDAESVRSLKRFQAKLALFFAGCVLVAGVFGTITVHGPRAWIVLGFQALAGMVVLVALIRSH